MAAVAVAGVLFFYAWCNPRYPILILYVTAIDYLAVLAMGRTRWKKPWLMLSIANNLALLGYAKYSSFWWITSTGCCKLGAAA